MPRTTTPTRPRAAKRPKAAAPRQSLDEAMRALERAGSAQTRRTYERHGARGPMFGVSFAALKVLRKRIGVDHELALDLWRTGNLDARMLAVKVADPQRMAPADLDRWARAFGAMRCGMYVASLAVEGPHGAAKADEWLASEEEPLRCAGWGLVGQLAARDETKPDAWFAERLAVIERTIRSAPNLERDAMNRTVIEIGGRSAALRRSSLAAARRIGKVAVDYGDTECKTPDAGPYIEKMWAHAAAKGFESPSAQERAREVPRTRC